MERKRDRAGTEGRAMARALREGRAFCVRFACCFLNGKARGNRRMQMERATERDRKRESKGKGREGTEGREGRERERET